ncbi:hypothetical protein [Streptomyces hundungensis]|uniref:hypothetical protein n=1 Tax=Streptomyces hundungensis TaxID=1077946 RepID=UPI003F53F01C
MDKTPETNNTGTPPFGSPPAPGSTDAADERALRRLLHGTVEDLKPSEGALEHLRAAVPLRRARKRQAVVGSIAAALLVATAVPAFLHVANTAGSADDLPAVAGHGERTHGTPDPASGTVEATDAGGRPSSAGRSNRSWSTGIGSGISVMAGSYRAFPQVNRVVRSPVTTATAPPPGCGDGAVERCGRVGTTPTRWCPAACSSRRGRRG